MAKGASSKVTIEEKLLSTFENSFRYGKEIRIPLMEDGEEVQIKVTLTCAKVNVEPGGDTAMPSKSGCGFVGAGNSSMNSVSATEAEKAAVAKLMQELNIKAD